MNNQIIKLDFVNVFLIRVQDGFILIDTGMHQAWEKLEEELRSNGCTPNKLKLVILTHGDFDHTGNCAQLQEKYRVKIAMHQADAFMAENGTRIKLNVKTLFGGGILFLLKRLHGNTTFLAFKPDILLAGGESLEQYGFNAKIIHIPGHTKGSIGILSADGDLFVGDTLINLKKPAIGKYIESKEDLKNSLCKLNKLDIKNIYPGHGNPFLKKSFFRNKRTGFIKE